MNIRAIRGAVQLDRDERLHMQERVCGLLDEILARNGLRADDLISVLFTATPDIRAGFPAEGVRNNNLTDVPLMCAQELAVHGALPRVVRILVHAETVRPREEIRHVYLGAAERLRPDLVG